MKKEIICTECGNKDIIGSACKFILCIKCKKKKKSDYVMSYYRGIRKPELANVNCRICGIKINHYFYKRLGHCQNCCNRDGKKCSECNEIKTIDNFYTKSKNIPMRFKSICKECICKLAKLKRQYTLCTQCNEKIINYYYIKRGKCKKCDPIVRKARVTNPEVRRKKLKKEIDELKESYVLGNILRNNLEFDREDITPEIIELKRAQILLKRKFREKKNEKTKIRNN